MLKNIFLKKMLKTQLKDMPEKEQEKIIKLVQENPELFQKIGLEIQQKIKDGKDKMTASMEVMQSYQEDLRKIM